MEDPEVLDECSRLERKDAVVTYLDPITTGRVEVAMIENELKENTELILSLIHISPYQSSQKRSHLPEYCLQQPLLPEPL